MVLMHIIPATAYDKNLAASAIRKKPKPQVGRSIGNQIYKLHTTKAFYI